MFYAALIALTSVLDLALKSGVESQPDTAYPRDVKGTGGLVQVRKLHNEGFPMGIMKEKPELVRCLPLAVASSLLLRFSCLLPKKGNHLEKAGLAFMIGGACSNLFDRFFRGYVVDYLYINKEPASKVIFNLGDVFIAGGTVLAGLSGLFRAVTERKKR